MADSIQFTLVIHNHQPVGNFDHVYQEACERSYLPFLRTLLDFPAVRIGLHTSGSLWEWLEANRRDYGELVDELLKRGQVELLGGGMWEPILPVLPHRDAVRQLRRLSQFLGERFGVKPTGMWVPERVWEPHMPALIAEAGLRWCLLDDTHFEGNAPAARVRTDYFVTSHGSAQVAILPISKHLRYTIPFRPPVETLDYLRELMQESEQQPLAVFGDDGEKFGIWPDTYDWVYEQGWLRQFFQALTDSADWLRLELPGTVVDSRRPAGSVYIPTRSYSEMGEWTRLDPNAGEDAPPGHWRNFMAKYHEAQAMYDRVCEVSAAVAEHPDAPQSALDDLGRAQCNCVYWHGVFGGLYLNYLRQAVTHHLLKAEQALGDPESDATHLRNDLLSVKLDPDHGICISRLDYYPTLFCWTDVLARSTEAYHAKLSQAAVGGEPEHASIHDIVRVKEAGLDRRLVVDPHPRVSFSTYLCTAIAPEQFLFTSESDLEPPRYALQDYFVPTQLDESSGDTRSGSVIHPGDITLRKQIRLDGAALELSVELTQGTLPTDSGRFWVEFNVTALTDQSADRWLELDEMRTSLDKGEQRAGIQRVALVDNWQQRRLVLEPDRRMSLLTYPVYTVSSSEGGFERTYQGTCIMLGIEPGDLRELRIRLAIEEI